MKQLETCSVNVGDNTFYLRPFPAFKAANVFGQLTTLITPIISGLLPLADSVGGNKNVFDLNMNATAPVITGAFSSLSGDKLETLLKELLIASKNVTVDDPQTGKTVMLTEDLANELFCGDTQDMFLLAWEVMKLNYNNFFKKLGDQFGAAFANLTKTNGEPSSENMGN